MYEHLPRLLASWTSFYVMTGSSSAALIGLMFVVITLVTRLESQTAQDGIATYSTPTVMYFGIVLLVSAILCAPWHSLAWVAALIGLIGLWGVVYSLRIILRGARTELNRVRGQSAVYAPDLEDWIWYTILPFVVYAIFLTGAITMAWHPAVGLFILAAAVILLIFIGIRNAWDTVTFLAIRGPNG
jgi:hypothetical protein